MDDRYEIKLENIFEGPMDLLVHLIKKNEVDIYDIPVALITEQYLEYLEWMKSMNIDVAGEFLVLAATLAHIKSRMLLPVHGEEEEEDVRMEIARPLLEYLQMKSAAEQLGGRHLLGEDTFVRQLEKSGYQIPREEEVIRVGLFELIDAFQRILNNLPEEHRVNIVQDRVSVQERINELVDLLAEKGFVVFHELFPPGSGRREVVVTFLAVLEMVKLGLLRIAQDISSGTIRLFYE